MNLHYAVKEYLEREPTDKDCLLMDDGYGNFTWKWYAKDKPKPTLKQLETIYENNKNKIENEMNRLSIINENRQRILNKLIEKELINEGLIE